MKRLINALSLSRKLLAAPSMLALFFVLSGVIAFWGLQTQHAAIDEIFNDHYASTTDAARVSQLIAEAQGEGYKFITWARANYDQTKIDAVGKSQVAKIDEAMKLIDKIIASSDDPERKDRYTKMRTEVESYKKAASNVIDLASFDLNAATMGMGGAEELFAGLAKTLSDNQSREMTGGQKSYDDATASYSRVTFLFIAVFATAMILSLVVTLWINGMILSPIRSTSEVIGAVAQGDLTHRVRIETTDELGTMADRFNGMVDNLSSLLRDIQTATTTIAAATAEISSSTEQMAAGAHEQTSQATEVAGAVDSMTHTIIENSMNAKKTSETAKEARAAAESGGKVVSSTIEGMKRIAEVSRRSTETVQTLGRSSEQIGEIIGVINDIADQTNLLALNAAIEAARAGEQGRGFAVVADEVRKLAERTTKATKEIAEMIKSIQRDTATAVESMQQGNSEVERGISLADQAGDSLRKIVEISKEVTEMILRIATVSEEQSASSGQIASNVNAITGVTQETAKGTEQVARAADDLNQLTSNLQSLIGRFTLSEEETRRAGKPHPGAARTPKALS